MRGGIGNGEERDKKGRRRKTEWIIMLIIVYKLILIIGRIEGKGSAVIGSVNLMVKILDSRIQRSGFEEYIVPRDIDSGNVIDAPGYK